MAVLDADNPKKTGEDFNTWLTRMDVNTPRAGESYPDWKERVCQQHPEEEGTGLAVGKFKRRVDGWNKAHPDPNATPAAKTGATAARGGGAPAAPTTVVEDIPAFSASKVEQTMQVGSTDFSRKRIRLYFHLFPIPGIPAAQVEQNARRRAMKWVRRVYAQANFAPKILGVERLAEMPPKNMLTINAFNCTSPAVAKTTSGKKRSDLAQNSVATVVLMTASGDTRTIVAPLAKDLYPEGIGASIVRALVANDANFSAVAHSVAPADCGQPTSCDILITHSGQPVTLQSAVHDDSDLQDWAIQIPTLAADGELDDDDTQIGGSPMQRRILRMGTSADDRIDVYVVPKMKIHGRAYPGYEGIPDTVKPAQPIRRAVIMCYQGRDGKSMDESDSFPFVLSHEIDHVLANTGHNEAEGDCMNGRGPKANDIKANKHIYGAPLLVSPITDLIAVASAVPIPRPNQDMRADMHNIGAPHLTDGWV